MLPDRAAGTLTFLFTDIEGSTRLWERFPQVMKGALERHDAILRTSVTAAGGRVVKTTGDGLMAVFGSSADALRSCLIGVGPRSIGAGGRYPDNVVPRFGLSQASGITHL